MTVCIKLARDFSNDAPDMPSSVWPKAGELQYIRGPIYCYCDPFDDLDPDDHWMLHGSQNVKLSQVFHNPDVAEVFIWPDRCHNWEQKPGQWAPNTWFNGPLPGFTEEKRCKNLVAPCPECQARFEAEKEKFAGAPWPTWIIPGHETSMARKVAFRHGPFVFLYERGIRRAACELATVLELNGPSFLRLDKWVDDQTVYYRQFAPGGDLQPVSQTRFLLG